MEQANLEPVVIEDLIRIGEDLAYDQARHDLFVRLFARHLGRTLTEGETETLSQRIETLSLDRLDDVLFHSSSKTLAAWLADPAAR